MKNAVLAPTLRIISVLSIFILALGVFAAASENRGDAKAKKKKAPKPPAKYLETTLENPLVNGAGTGVFHRFLKSGWKSESIAIVGKDGKVEWELKDARETSDSWFLRDGGVIFSHSDGVTRLSAKKKVLWTHTIPEGRRTNSCQPIDGGGFLIGENGNGAWLVELDADGKERKRIKISDREDAAHGFRQIRKTPQGTYLACIMTEDTTYEWDKDGKQIRTFPFGHYVALRLKNGNTLISGGNKRKNGLRIVEYDKKGEMVWSLGVDDEEKLGFGLRMICGMQALPNGNIVACNLFHGGSPEAPELFEITRDKKVVWLVKDDRLNRVGSIQILDVRGKALK